MRIFCGQLRLQIFPHVSDEGGGKTGEDGGETRERNAWERPGKRKGKERSRRQPRENILNTTLRGMIKLLKAHH